MAQSSGIKLGRMRYDRMLHLLNDGPQGYVTLCGAKPIIEGDWFVVGPPSGHLRVCGRCSQTQNREGI